VKKTLQKHSLPRRRGAAPRKVRYAVVGLGHIAQVAVLPAFEHARKNSVLTALVSDDPRKLAKLARKYSVEETWSYEDYVARLRSGSVDAVYIALPNSMHRDFAVQAAQAGVHVLCEKPLALTEKDCLAMLRVCEEHDVRLMTAYRLHFERANLGAVEIARSGRIGEPRLFDSVFTMQVDDEDNIRLRRETGGGPLWDIGIYCINAARCLFQAEPVEVAAQVIASPEPRFAEVEEAVAAVLRFPGERLATFTCSFGAAPVSAYRLVGTKGSVRVEPAYEHAGDLRHVLTIGRRTREQVFPARDQFAAELLYFSRCVLAREEPEPSGREGLADVRVIRALQRAAESGRTVRLEDFEKLERPGPEQEIRVPPSRKPEEIGSRSPARKR
jgi:glucose-fructose oxidoreductase